MLDEIQQLEEAIAGTARPLISPQSKADPEEEDGETLAERAAAIAAGPSVSMAQLNKLVDAMVEAPKVQSIMSSILKKSGGGGPSETGREEALQTTFRGFLQHSIPIALQDAGLKPTSPSV